VSTFVIGRAPVCGIAVTLHSDSGAIRELLKTLCRHIERRSGGASDGDNFVGDVLADRAELDLLFEPRDLGVERV
jgi:hypothetical protein